MIFVADLVSTMVLSVHDGMSEAWFDQREFRGRRPLTTMMHDDCKIVHAVMIMTFVEQRIVAMIGNSSSMYVVAYESSGMDDADAVVDVVHVKHAVIVYVVSNLVAAPYL
jgi:hypothetical protein